MASINVGGLTPLSATDYPGLLSAVVFCQGCPWRCGYCHNPHLLPADTPSRKSWAEVHAFLTRRQGLLDAVVFSGGEPTLQAELADVIQEVRALGFKIGLHTAGMYPSRLNRILPLIDWVGMDIKAPFEDYERITGVPTSGEKAASSAQLLINSGVSHEFRTTWHPQLLDHDDLLRLAEQLADMGANNYVLQVFRAQGCADGKLLATSVTDKALGGITALLGPYFERFSMRQA